MNWIEEHPYVQAASIGIDGTKFPKITGRRLVWRYHSGTLRERVEKLSDEQLERVWHQGLPPIWRVPNSVTVSLPLTVDAAAFRAALLRALEGEL